LRIANSSFYGLESRVSSIDSAIAFIGLNAVRTMIIGSGVTGAFRDIPGLNLRSFWAHALLTALIAREIARNIKQDPEAAYTAGLMHTIGILLIHLAYPAGAAKVAESCMGRGVAERKSAEDTLLSLNHCQVGAELASRWHFPPAIIDTLLHYANPLDQEAGILAALVYVASHIAFGVEAGTSAQHIADTLDPEITQKLNIDRIDWIDRIEEYASLRTEVEGIL
jgi:HD-like signal output (HDOD) protein